MIQGEYIGVVETDGQTWGTQVIALGDGKFRCVGYPGGLPGDGYKPGTETKVASGELAGEVAKLHGDKFDLEIVGGQLKVKSAGGDTLGTLDEHSAPRAPRWDRAARKSDRAVR